MIGAVAGVAVHQVRCVRWCWLATLFALTGCVRDHTLFEDLSDASAGSTDAADASREAGGSGGTGAMPEAGGSGGASATPEAGGQDSGGAADAKAPWDQVSCLGAIAEDHTGEACVDGTTCSAISGCCQNTIYCKGTTLTWQKVCDRCPTTCKSDAECSIGELCEADRCIACPNDPCPSKWSTRLRNGCKVCVPVNQCDANTPCAGGLSCVAGFSCLPGCKATDPSCCFGNQCAPSNCGPPKGVDCATVGCDTGSVCKGGVDAVACSCDAKTATWSCTNQPKNACIAR